MVKLYSGWRNVSEKAQETECLSKKLTFKCISFCVKLLKVMSIFLHNNHTEDWDNISDYLETQGHIFWIHFSCKRVIHTFW